ncbi:hypothetical protein BDN71DRAFT_1531631 [Pleurotus eryngii]|uniref:Uncharacterized protein n=1 Tax=Pleurotus eryngii TaxID=5323 RepID=A0A9P5ZJB6_PLEER|nr:hypothetical protein BDN71DRAFT_1531631 [Pleurotus eryngii]
MQLRIYILFGASKEVALVNGILYLGSVAGWVYILVHNVSRTEALIADAVRLPPPGCPTIHVSTEWAPRYVSTAYEGILFSFAAYKAITNAVHCQETQRKHISLYCLLVRDDLLYFLAVLCILVFNNLVVVPISRCSQNLYRPHVAQSPEGNRQ